MELHKYKVCNGFVQLTRLGSWVYTCVYTCRKLEYALSTSQQPDASPAGDAAVEELAGSIGASSGGGGVGRRHGGSGPTPEHHT